MCEVLEIGKSENLVKKKKLSLFFKLNPKSNTTFQVTEKELMSLVRYLQNKIINKYFFYGQMTLNDS